MRKFILIAALVLASASAQAAGTRGLTMASNDEPAATQPATATTSDAVKPADTAKDTKAADTPKFVERPPVVDPAATKTDAIKPDATKAPAAKAEKAKHKRESTEARVIYELHRHGIYW